MRNIIFTNEVSITLHKAPNKQNVRMWSEDNPREVYAARSRYPGRLKVWAGILNGNILGPVFIDDNLTETEYLELLVTHISEGVAQDDTSAELWWMRDGCPAHNWGPAKEFLHASFPNRVIGTNKESIAWLPQTPDVNPCDYFLWGYIQSDIYHHEASLTNLHNLQTTAADCCARITQAQLAEVQRNFVDRLGYRVTVDKDLFEHLM